MVRETDWAPNTFILRITKRSSSHALDMANFYNSLPQVVYAEPDFVLEVKLLTNDPNYGSQWFLDNPGGYPYYGTVDADIDAPEAWSITTGSSSIIVAIVDNGLQISHPDLNDHVATGYDAVGGDNDPTPNSWDGHGTCCAGLAAAETNNSLGVASIGYNVHVMGCRIFYSAYNGGPLIGQDSWIVDGINYARMHADIISCSWSMSSPVSSITNAFNTARTSGRGGLGMPIFCATGNENTNDIAYPAELTSCIAVGATNENDDRCNPSDWGSGQGSNYGPEIDIVAPGKWQTTTDYTGSGGYSGGDYTIAGAMGTFGGTSGATPLVAGVAALVLSVNPTLTAAQAEGILEHTANDLVGRVGEDVAGWDQYMGWGRVNAYNAVDSTNRAYFPPPTNLNAGDGFDSYVPLNWTQPSRTPNRYRIYRSTVGSSGPYTVRDSTVALTYNDSSVVNGSTYWYKLKAIYSNGESDYSNIDSGTPQHYYAPPTNLVADDGYNHQVPLHWTSPGAGVLRYRIYRSTVDSSSGFVLYDSSATTSKTDTNVVNGNTYWYKVTAYYSSPPGESGYSNVDSGTPLAPPAPPQNLTATSGLDGHVPLQWSAPSLTLSYYRIYRSGTGSSGTYVVLDSTSNTNYDDYAVINGHAYWYKLKAIYTNPSRESDFSNIAEAHPGLPNQAPVIVHDPMHDSDISTPTLTAIVTDDYSPTPMVILYYRLHGGSFVSTAMFQSGYDHQYMATLPTMSQGKVEYYISATDDSGAVTRNPSGAPAQWYSFDVGDINGNELAYDDGGWERTTYVDTTAEEWAVKFTPSAYPFYLKGAEVSLGHGFPDSLHQRFTVKIYDDDGPDYRPRTLLWGPDTTGSIGNVVGAMAWLNRNVTYWAPVVIRDSSGTLIRIEAGAFYISVKNLAGPPWLECFNRDSSGWNQQIGSQSYFYDPCQQGWYSEDDTVANHYARRSHRMIRALGGSIAQVEHLLIERENDDIRLIWHDNGSPFYAIYADTLYPGNFTNQVAVLPDTTWIDHEASQDRALRFYQVRGSVNGPWGN